MTPSLRGFHPMQQLVNSLLAEKDQLIKEKDELVESKGKLWSSMYEQLRERDDEIKTLKQGDTRLQALEEQLLDKDLENEKLRRHNTQLLDALKKALGEGNDGDDDEDEDDEDEDEEDDKDGVWRHINATWKPHFSAAQGLDNYPTPVASSPSAGDRLFKNRSKFTFHPVSLVKPDDTFEFANLEDVDQGVKESILAQLDFKEERRGVMKPASYFNPSSACLSLWTLIASDARWTEESKCQYTCFSCFNARRVCMRWLGSGTWAMLPLPPAVREDTATWTNKRYYIHPDIRDRAQHFDGVWEESKDGRKKRAKQG
jgi:hypothetical protein